jgi:uncharacterized protein (TIGR02001 family)
MVFIPMAGGGSRDNVTTGPSTDKETKMKLLKGIAISLVLGTLAAPAAMADDMEKSPWGTFTGNVALANDYVFRGVSQTLNSATIQGGLDWDSGMGIYLGTWGSNIDFGGGTDGGMELDVYGGYKGTIGEAFTYDVGAIGYLYPGSASSANLDYWEGKVALGYDFGPFALSASFYYSPDFTGAVGDAYYFNGGVSVPIPGVDGLSISGAVGHQSFDRAGVIDYTDYNIGATYAFKWATLDIRWYDTDLPSAAFTIVNAKGPHTISDSRVVAKISRAF